MDDQILSLNKQVSANNTQIENLQNTHNQLAQLVKDINDEMHKQNRVDDKLDEKIAQMQEVLASMQSTVNDFKQTTALIVTLQHTVNECQRALKYMWATIFALFCLLTGLIGAYHGEFIGKVLSAIFSL